MSSIRSISIVSLSFFIQTVSSIIFYLVVARTLPVNEVGAITLFLSFGGIFVVAFSLNLDTGFTHFISYFMGRTGKYSLPRFFLTITAIIMVISFAVVASISHVIASVFFHSSSYSAIIILMGGYVSYHGISLPVSGRFHEDDIRFISEIFNASVSKVRNM